MALFKYSVVFGKGDMNQLVKNSLAESSMAVGTQLKQGPDLLFQLPIIFYVGFAGALFVLAFVVYSTSRRQEFLWYGIYLLFLLIYLGQKSDLLISVLIRSGRYWQYSAHELSQVVINLSYVLFVKYFLDTQKNYKLLNKAIHWISIGLIIFFRFEIFLLTTRQLLTVQPILMNVHRSIMSLFALCGVIYLLIYASNRLVWFIVIGSSLFVGGAVSSWII